jgi:hypothetical protein
LGFGAGVAVTFGQPRVTSAVAVGPSNIVRVTDSSNVMAGLVFESHYFFVPQVDFGWGLVTKGNWGTGPFVAVDASTSDGSTVIAGVSMGWMVGFRRTKLTPVARLDGNGKMELLGQTSVPDTTIPSWNFGVGFRVDPRATVLGDGIVANAPLPPGETNPVRLNKVPRYGVMLLTSFTF